MNENPNPGRAEGDNYIDALPELYDEDILRDLEEDKKMEIADEETKSEVEPHPVDTPYNELSEPN